MPRGRNIPTGPQTARGNRKTLQIKTENSSVNVQSFKTENFGDVSLSQTPNSNILDPMFLEIDNPDSNFHPDEINSHIGQRQSFKEYSYFQNDIQNQNRGAVTCRNQNRKSYEHKFFPDSIPRRKSIESPTDRLMLNRKSLGCVVQRNVNIKRKRKNSKKKISKNKKIEGRKDKNNEKDKIFIANELLSQETVKNSQSTHKNIDQKLEQFIQRQIKKNNVKYR